MKKILYFLLLLILVNSSYAVINVLDDYNYRGKNLTNAGFFNASRGEINGSSICTPLNGLCGSGGGGSTVITVQSIDSYIAVVNGSLVS